MSRALGVVPARMGSSRFPGKPLALLAGLPMIQHVFERTAGCRLLDEVVIATCDDEIARAAVGFGARAVMTAADHERATDRVAEVSARDGADIIVMVQGDEPMVRPEMVEAVVRALRGDPSLSCVNLAAPIQDEDELRDPNTIKLVTDYRGRALYFSRSPIPHGWRQSFHEGTWLKQICVMAFTRDALRSFAALPQGPLEVAESVDMLRFLEHRLPVQVAMTAGGTHAVDTPEDLARVAALMAAQQWPAQGATGA